MGIYQKNVSSLASEDLLQTQNSIAMPPSSKTDISEDILNGFSVSRPHRINKHTVLGFLYRSALPGANLMGPLPMPVSGQNGLHDLTPRELTLIDEEVVYKGPCIKRDVVKSFGVLLFHKAPQLKFLIQQRRDTYEYVDFLLGEWNNKVEIEFLLSRMTLEEQDRLVKYHWSVLIKDMCLNGERRFDITPFLRRKHSALEPLLKEMIQRTKKSRLLAWEFPKGRKDRKIEGDLHTALREFEEETTISKDALQMFDVKPFTEVHKGTDERIYVASYFLMESLTLEMPVARSVVGSIRGDTMISPEVSRLKWVSVEEGIRLLSYKKGSMIQKAAKLIANEVI